MAMAKADPHAAGAGAADYLRLLALIGQGWMWTEMVQAPLMRARNDPVRATKPAMAESSSPVLLLRPKPWRQASWREAGR